MKTFFTLSPLAKKRLRQFFHIRRAVVSLVLLLSLFVVSLFSELLCNGTPLFVRHNGSSWFPFLQRVTLADLGQTKAVGQQVDWRALSQSAAFVSNPANRIVWAPVPFSPDDVIRPDSLNAFRSVLLSIVPEAQLGRFDLLADGSIVRTLACEPFFGGTKETDGLKLASFWNLSPAFLHAIQARRDGEARPAEVFALTNQAGSVVVDAVLPPLPKRSAQPSVRITLREQGSLKDPLWMRIKRSKTGAFVGLDLEPIPENAHRAVEQMVLCAFSAQVQPKEIPWGEKTARVSCALERISWPFRPVPGHWMGIDSAGRDVFARVLYGMRISLIFGLALAVWAMVSGVFFGALQGFFGGWVDMAGQRITEIWSALPFLYVMIFIGSALGRSFLLLLICYGIFNWIGISYYMRAEFLRLRQRTFVEAARCQGFSSFRMIFGHILPNALTPLITLFPFTLMGAIGSLAALDFLGFGLPPMTPSWGELLHQAQQFRSAWWLILFPSITLFTVMLLAVMIGEGLRDAFDPRQQSRLE